MGNKFKEWKDSSIILASDHGVGMPSIYFPCDFYRIEEKLPMLYVIINDRKNFIYKEQYKYPITLDHLYPIFIEKMERNENSEQNIGKIKST